ncbi:MAG TPA: aa3-type cytochrome c oxidase subunit IV [Hyphomicrobiaceae bacterium]|nr:aa3-type cytochrome c oxidase subunit IV [Hyphomicrobiaceae bacterium]
MAIDPTGGHPAMDYPEHLRTYAGFVKGTMITIALIALILLFLLTLVP